MSENPSAHGSIPVVSSPHPHFAHEVLGVVLSVRDGALSVLLWQRGRAPQRGAWALPGGIVEATETLESSIRRHLAAKVDVDQVAHLEQLETRSEPARHPDERVIATGFLGVVPSDASPALPSDTRWHPIAKAGHAGVLAPVDDLPKCAFDHRALITAGQARLRAKLSYTNVAFALAPETFTISELRTLYVAALGYDVDATNLQRVLVRREVIAPTAVISRPGRSGGRPAARFRFRSAGLVVTDPFAVLRPPGP